ncbi:hypothetical protein EHI8A_144290 [Entamoeba histolytica HM-1:IMSS-B]|uniref:Uncharacterized protein n=6 Tax=Entamoeba histolytica TaxID=5759 RepID=C4MAE8_ENTH1|nr:hypothetical protein EHI_119770 [Entamoeba histolytica HM-1:IMSS]EMD46296.1 Hypothetical protein EHI5A_171560 [Entamoeba histolytica KU27]EMH76711.1 hypothetical protein EHI8A_144290 [Entamoeba histolytica HM-1:IMSS-B]EMS11362.1 hypothetical protein KM1_220000 [Entamoeba histolytica HM-3:IMSS]ENY61770.1 hypothetical protein EHI7A_127280 [Entamoeba histolytica HM-1:IMSS-A]GAT98771.1 hypothetical protein CL6EHI_119770 [Entamoeba histolytica]|eukprot:XP_649351.1 hypothetical protein EHI_119770 [Entamoeba histolytica HM-1:IMSS]
MTNMNRPRDDIYMDVAAMDILDVYTEAQSEPNVNAFLKKFYYTMKEPSYIDWKINNSDKVKSDEDRRDLIRQKLESIRRCERISRYLDENNIGLNSFNAWNKKFAKKCNKKTVDQSTIPDWVRKSSRKQAEEVDVDVIRVEENENESKRALLRPLKSKDEEKKPKKVETKDN